jgi:hypothetical protein
MKPGDPMRRVLLLVFVLGASFAARAGSNAAIWANLNTLRAGEKIQVREVNKSTVNGTFLNVTEAAISVQADLGSQTIQKENVRSVKVRRNRSGGRNALMGAALGGLAGAGTGAAAWPGKGSILGGKGSGAAVGAISGGVIGSIVGALVPAHETIYSVSLH